MHPLFEIFTQPNTTSVETPAPKLHYMINATHTIYIKHPTKRNTIIKQTMHLKFSESMTIIRTLPKNDFFLLNKVLNLSTHQP